MGRKSEDRIEEMERLRENQEQAAQIPEESKADTEQTARISEESKAQTEHLAQTSKESKADREQAAQIAEAFRHNRKQEVQWPEEAEAGRKRKGRRRGDHRLTGSMAAKVVAFFLLAICSFFGIVSAVACLYMGTEGYYASSLNDVLTEELQGMVNSVFYEVKDYIELGDTDAAKEICLNKNLDLELYFYDDTQTRSVIWTTWNGYTTGITTDIFCSFGKRAEVMEINGHKIKPYREYWFRAYVDPEFPIEDEFQSLAVLVTWGYEFRYLLIGLVAGCIFLCAACFIFLLCAAGHRNGREGIAPSVLTYIYFDVLTGIFAGVLFFLAIAAFAIMREIYQYGVGSMSVVVGTAIVAAMGTAAVVLTTLYFMDIALRLKQGKWWRHTLVYVVLRMLWRVGRFICRGLGALLGKVPLVLTTLTFFLGIAIFDLAVIVFARPQVGVLLWGLEKFFLLNIVMYVAIICKKLLGASRALAEGQENYQVDTSMMLGDFKEHGENLNSLGQGISRAVAERMKSEHLKTELITNVSHDIKTPLTSIINYADLICEETMRNKEEDQRPEETALGQGTEGQSDSEGGVRNEEANSCKDARIREYAEVLLRQSRRLKKLLEDLVEASKATTGNLEVDLKPCEVGVLLSQAVGEYQQRMEEKGLELIARQPEHSVIIIADGRHLWRVFDNLLNNICKYAQERSRVYLSVEEKQDRVQIIFRNMSKYPLDISGEELQERFVRGDRSRHMEGNGLGLSIAKSLIELQDGKMEIVMDGDLFKVILCFSVRKPV